MFLPLPVLSGAHCRLPALTGFGELDPLVDSTLPSQPRPPQILSHAHHTCSDTFCSLAVVLFVCLFFGRATQHARSQFPDQGLNPCPLQWKLRVSTTGPPGKSELSFVYLHFQILTRKAPLVLADVGTTLTTSLGVIPVTDGDYQGSCGP